MKKIFFQQRRNFFVTTIYSLVFLLPIYGWTQPPAEKIKKDSLLKVIETVIQEGLFYIENDQVKETILGKQYAGEWPTYMVMHHGFFLLGGRRKAKDSNCFSVASTHNLLAKIYLENKKYISIPKILDPAFKLILQYHNQARFNFWNSLPPNKKLYLGDTLFPKVLVRRPTNFKLRTRYINKAANVVEDADDTGLAYAAIALRKKMMGSKDALMPKKFPRRIAPIFDQYRDLNRNNRHWFNYINEAGDEDNSGAYLTWHAQEYQFKKWDILKVVVHNATFYLPFSECYPFAYKPYMPYGSNDIDAVVNANVLSTLALYNESNALGYKDACEYLINKCKKKRYDRVATYYPNRFQLAFAIGNAYDSGVKELEECREILNKYLTKNQRKDGSWKSAPHINRGDKIQSTAYALNSLLLLNRNNLKVAEKEIEKGIAYLLGKSKKENGQTHWEGGVMFSGGTVVRTSLFWKSDAYTTALVLRVLVMYHNSLTSQ